MFEDVELRGGVSVGLGADRFGGRKSGEAGLVKSLSGSPAASTPGILGRDIGETSNVSNCSGLP